MGVTTIVPVPLAAGATTLTVGLDAMPVKVPPEPSRVWVVKVTKPVVAGSVIVLPVP